MSLFASAKRLRIRHLVAAASVAFAAASLAGCSGTRQTANSPPTQDERAYLQDLQFTKGRVEAATNFLGHTVTTFHSEVTNKGKKTVLYIEVNLTFYDIDGKAVEQRKAYPVGGATLPLKPGETRPFQVSFDQVPDLWNQAPPKVTPVRVVLAGE